MDGHACMLKRCTCSFSHLAAHSVLTLRLIVLSRTHTPLLLHSDLVRKGPSEDHSVLFYPVTSTSSHFNIQSLLHALAPLLTSLLCTTDDHSDHSDHHHCHLIALTTVITLIIPPSGLVHKWLCTSISNHNFTSSHHAFSVTYLLSPPSLPPLSDLVRKGVSGSEASKKLAATSTALQESRMELAVQMEDVFARF